jgi:hypothetical protein
MIILLTTVCQPDNGARVWQGALAVLCPEAGPSRKDLSWQNYLPTRDLPPRVLPGTTARVGRGERATGSAGATVESRGSRLAVAWHRSNRQRGAILDGAPSHAL